MQQSTIAPTKNCVAASYKLFNVKKIAGCWRAEAHARQLVDGCWFRAVVDEHNSSQRSAVLISSDNRSKVE